MAKTQAIPLERHEQANFVVWLERQTGLRFTAIPNSTWTSSHAQKRLNYVTGLRPGFPDMVVIITPQASKDGSGYVLAIEMKRTKGGVVSIDQKSWIETLNNLDTLQVQAYIAKGAEEAKTIVSHYLKSPNNNLF